MCSLWNILGDECETIKIIDVGAMMLGKNPPSYRELLKLGDSKVVGFEPNEEERRKLNQSCTGDCLFLPYFIGDGSEQTFNLCNYNMTSSLYEPNTNLLEKFQALSEFAQVVERTTVSTKRLDDIDEVQGADYLKVDAQGAEVDVFNGAKKLLTDIMVIHTEVEFVPIYKNQPLFAEVDQVLRKNGFLFHKFYPHSITGRTFKPLVCNNDINSALSQILWADVIYVKNFMEFDSVSVDKLLKLSVIMHYVYHSFDIVHYLLQHCDKRTESKWAQRYMVLFNKNDQQ